MLDFGHVLGMYANMSVIFYCFSTDILLSEPLKSDSSFLVLPGFRKTTHLLEGLGASPVRPSGRSCFEDAV
jgi:hypothetical protein